MMLVCCVQVHNGRIGMLWLHRQLTEEDKDESLHEPLSCFPTPFPRDSLLLADAAQHAAQSAKMVDGVRGWWQAWAAGPNHNASSGGGGSSSNHSAASSTSTSNGTSNSRSRSRNDKAAAAAQLLAPDFRMLVSAWLALYVYACAFICVFGRTGHIKAKHVGWSMAAPLLSASSVPATFSHYGCSTAACWLHYRCMMAERFPLHLCCAGCVWLVAGYEGAGAQVPQQRCSTAVHAVTLVPL